MGFGFREIRGNAFSGGDMMLGNADKNVRGALLIAERTAHRRWAQPLPAGTFVDESLVDVELVHIER